MPDEAHRLHQLVDPAGRHAADPGLLDHRDQRLLGGLARLQERREVRPLPQLRDAQLERAEPRVERAVAIAVAVIQPIAAALVPAGADQPFDIGFHQDLQHRLRHGSQEIAVAALLQQLDQRHSVLGHRVLGQLGVKPCNSTLADLPGDHLSPAQNFHHLRGRYLNIGRRSRTRRRSRCCRRVDLEPVDPQQPPPTQERPPARCPAPRSPQPARPGRRPGRSSVRTTPRTPPGPTVYGPG